MGNILAIVGRPNVGKSTFFNRLVKSRQAIVEETSGVTRDRHYGRADWNGIEFSVIDTGGYVVGSDDIFEEEIRKQAMLAIDEADVIVFILDVKDGLTSLDEDVANVLRRTEKKVFIVANKVDNSDRIGDASEFYQIGMGEVYCVSAINGSGTGDLLDDVVKEFDNIADEDVPDLPKIAVVGRPNVGKSSLINALIGIDRNIVTPIAGTTRDTIYTKYNSFGFDFLFVDTAGLRKKSKVHENIEFYSVLRSVRAIENCDVCLLMIDAKNGFESQDQAIFHLAERNHKAIVIIVNKWDLIEKETNTSKEYEAVIREKLAPFTDVPIVFTSVVNKQRIHKALEVAQEVYNNRKLRIPTSELNEVMLPIFENQPPPSLKGKYIKIKYITQLPTQFPSIAVFCNLPQYVKDPYKRFVENKIRKLYNFSGVPLEIYFRKK